MTEELNRILTAFKIDAVCVDAKQHRHFSFYDVRLRPGCRISKLTTFSREIAMALKSKSIAPIIKTIPERGIVRLQMTHRAPDLLPLKEILATYPRPKGFLPFLLGETDEGNPMWVDMTTNPHLLIAGSTGSGKSVLLHNLIANAAQFPDLELYLVDTKKVEFSVYDNPDVQDLIPVVAKDYDTTVATLEYLVSVMENRYDVMASLNINTIDQRPEIFSKIMVIIDEVSDLMILDKSGQFEALISRLASKCRAAGIYLVLATQRPSVNVVTGVIKANFMGRLACKVTSKVDSRVIMDSSGAENLAGKGDALFKNCALDSTRLQIAHVNPIQTVQDYVTLKN